MKRILINICINLIASRAEFSNATKALIREIEQNLPKSVESGGSASSGGTQVSKEGRALESEADVKARGLESETPETGAGQKLEGRGLQNEQEARALPNEGIGEIPHNPAFGKNFEEFYHDPKGAIAKLIEAKEGQVAGAFYREDLGDIDLVWGEIRDQSGKLKGHGLAKIIEKHLDDFKGFEGNSALEKLGRGLEEIVENGKVVTDQAGIKTIILKKDNQEFRVGLTQGWKHEGDNYWIVTAYKRYPKESPAQKFDQVAAKSGLGSDLAQKDKPNPTTPPLKSQETKLLTYKPVSEIYKEAKAKGLSYAEFKALQSQNKRLYLENLSTPKSTAAVIKEARALGLKADEAIKAIKQNQKANLAGLKENERPLEIGESIPMQKLNGYASSISLDDTHIYLLDFVVVKTTDVKPNMQAKSGVQTRTQTDLNKVAEIANNFKPEYVINRGGFDDLPIIINDGQVIVGNHRALGMQEFSPESRKAYEQAISNTYGIELKHDELLVRTPKSNLTDKELINLASASNKERTTTFGDRLIAAIGKYDEYITPQNLKVLSLESSDVEELALRVAKMLDKQAKAPDIEATNLALLAHSARNNRTSLSEALDFAQKHLDQLEFTRLKDMFVKNAGSVL
ncbi:putative barnase/colicin E5 family endoribonuclease [Helicobacter suis]|uniref:putative barnase/colicin E5 family endoribonuclease n=2 Tax=Helicobacter suis TaxID=104628 RepID=UPI00054CFC5E|nr:DUF3519 domain-containing protein [Helicobacter suis]